MGQQKLVDGDSLPAISAPLLGGIEGVTRRLTVVSANAVQIPYQRKQSMKRVDVLAMKVQNFLPLSLFSLAICSLLLSSPLPVKADAGDPNGADNFAKKGWTLWQRWQNQEDGLYIGIGNGDYGLLQDTQDTQVACGASTDESKILETYWFRVDEKLDKSIQLNQEGMGTVEFGCWENGRFKAQASVDGWYRPQTHTPSTAPELQQSAPESGRLPESTERESGRLPESTERESGRLPESTERESGRLPESTDN